MNLFFNLASVARIAEVPVDSIDRFEIWDRVILVIFKKNRGLRPRFLSNMLFYSSFVEDRKSRSKSIQVTPNAFADRIYTARNESNDHTYTVIAAESMECQCADYRNQIAFIGKGCCKHGYAVLRSLGFSSLSDWQAIERIRKNRTPADWPQFTPRPKPTVINGRSID